MSILGDLLTSQQAAERAGVHLATIRRWVADEHLVPADRLPGKTGALLFRPEDVDRAATRKGGQPADSPEEAQS